MTRKSPFTPKLEGLQICINKTKKTLLSTVVRQTNVYSKTGLKPSARSYIAQCYRNCYGFSNSEMFLYSLKYKLIQFEPRAKAEVKHAAEALLQSYFNFTPFLAQLESLSQLSFAN